MNTDLYCCHGTFVGNILGPDHICGLCESGVTREQWEARQRQIDAALNARHAIIDAVKALCRANNETSMVSYFKFFGQMYRACTF